MSLTQVKELLERTARCHEMMADFYLRVQERSKNEPVKELAKNLAWHENQLTQEIDEFAKNEDQAMNGAWVQSKPEYDPETVLGSIQHETPNNREALLVKGIELDGYLVKFLNRVAKSAPSDEIKTVFQSLAKKEIQDQRKLAHMGRTH